MTEYVHIVQVHPVENGEPNLHKVKMEYEFDSKEEADRYIYALNADSMANLALKAVYRGRVNDATGELE